MKKNLSGKHKDHKGKKLSKTNRSKLRKSKKIEEIFRSPGPSTYITKGKNGKVTITNIVGKIKQKNYTTETGKNSRQENKATKQAKKELIKQILASARFEPTVHYTRKEKKKFTRLVKKQLFVQKILDNKKNISKFRYIVQNQSKDNPMRSIDFYTDYIDASNKEEAFSKVKVLAKKYKNSDKFNGITIEDLNNSNWTYYTKSKLLAA